MTVQNLTNADVETESFPAKTSLKAYGIDIIAHDISSLAPLKMINDNISVTYKLYVLLDFKLTI